MRNARRESNGNAKGVANECEQPRTQSYDPVGCASFLRENAPAPADTCENVQEHARPNRERAYKARSSKVAQGVVYFIRAGTSDNIKIGWTSNLKDRVRKLQCANPAPLRVIGQNRNHRRADDPT